MSQPPQQSRQARVGFPLRPSRPALLSLLFGATVTTACSEAFSPIEQSTLQYSVFGYLDAAADTQWVRVMPIRPVILTSPEPLNAEVTLEHLGSGRMIELKDSVFKFSQHNAGVGADGVYLHNYWTAERLEPGARYRFLAERRDAGSAEAVVEIPHDYEVEVWLRQTRTPPNDLVRLMGLERVALVRASTHFYDTCGTHIDRTNFFPTGPGDAGIHMVPTSKRMPPATGCGAPEVEMRELLVVGSVAEWPASHQYSPSALRVPDAPSNISNSVGFLGGVHTKRIPYEGCTLESPLPVADYCKLRYDAASATLKGTLIDERCGGGVARADVQLRELGVQAPSLPKLRFTRSNRRGEFQIAALEAGRQYSLTIQRTAYDDTNRPFDEYLVHTDTLQFAPGEQMTYQAVMRAIHPCKSQP